MEGKQKILVAGDVNGNFTSLFSRVEAINRKSGPFDFLFCVGSFFGESSTSWLPYKNGSKQVPVPTYILGPLLEEHKVYYNDINGCELCPNLNYLGKRGILTSGGLTIAYVSGTQGESSTSVNFSKKDVTELKDIVCRSKVASSPFLGVDILLTSAWPKNICIESTDNIRKSESDLLSWLAVHLRPRYHFAGLEGVYYERPPYTNYRMENEVNVHSTRFIAVSKIDNNKKDKWLYAASLTPIDLMKPIHLYQMTTDETTCPYPNVYSTKSSGQQYFYDMNASMTNNKRKGQEERYDGKRQAIDQKTCWFCLASPSVKKHLVISIGEHVYLALAKGGLTEYHALILPVQHHRSLAFTTEEIKSEIKKFKKALKKFSKKMKMVPVYFERNFRTSHMQLNFIAIPKSLAGNLKEVFLQNANEVDVDLNELPAHCELEDTAQPDRPYFYLELPDSTRCFSACKKNFPLEFGRDVLAGEDVLNMPHRISWRDCEVSEEEETALVNKFRETFKEFDFTDIDNDSD